MSAAVLPTVPDVTVMFAITLPALNGVLIVSLVLDDPTGIVTVVGRATPLTEIPGKLLVTLTGIGVI